MFALIVDLAILAVVGYAAYIAVMQYRASTNTGLARVWDAAKGSATALWAKFMLVVGGIVSVSSDAVDKIGPILADQSTVDSIKEGLQSYVTPNSVGVVLMGVAAVTLWARFRSLGKKSADTAEASEPANAPPA